MRKDPELAEAYKKDPDEERFLEQLNAALAPYEESRYGELPETYPTLHIVGVPRSGTTLLCQLIASHLDVGYVNNLVAAFWRAPVCGIRLSSKLLPRKVISSYGSDCGRTIGIHEPHEFGYFWSSVLGYEEMLQQDGRFEEQIDWQKLRLILINMTHAFGRPAVFKSLLLGWHVPSMQKVLPKTCFVRIRRDPVQNAISILKLRRRYLGSVESWAGMKPAEYSWLKDEPCWRQVAGQVYFLEKSMTEQIQKVGERNVLEVRYENLCQNPRGVLEQVSELLTANGSAVDFTSEPPHRFAASTDESLPEVQRERIATAVAELLQNPQASWARHVLNSDEG